MPFNGSGSFSPPAANYPAVTGTTATAADRNAIDADFASGLSNTITKDGQTTPTANIPLGANKITGLAAGAAATDAANIANLQNGTGIYVATVGGTADVITLTPNPAITAYAAGQRFSFIASGANTTNVTVNISALGAKAITKNGATALVANDILSSQIVVIEYDGTQFQLVGKTISVLDEDDMASDSATLPPSQQSVKAYVDAKLFSQISGLIQSNDATDATNDISVSSGSCADSTNSVVLSLSAARIKRLDASWVTGTNQGGLSSSLTIADTDYHIFIIRVGGVDDIGFDTSITAANLVADHSVTHYRRIGWFARGGNSAGVIDQFVASESAGGGLNFLWSTPKLDVNLNATLTTTRRTDAIRVPLDYSVTAHINAAVKDSATTQFAYIHCPDQADLAPNDALAPLMNIFSQTGRFGYQQMFIRTSATGTIAARASTATVDAYQVVTIGFEWSRR